MTATPRLTWHRWVEFACGHPRLALVLFLFGFLVLCGWGMGRSDSNPISSDLFSLVAVSGESALRDAGIERVRSLSEQQQTWIASHPDMDSAYAAAQQLAERLRASGLFSFVGGTGGSSGTADMIAFYAGYPYQLADDAALELARENNHSALVSRVERALYASAPALPAVDLQRDPFLLSAHFLQALTRMPAPFLVDRGMVAAYLDGRWSYLIPARLSHSAFDFTYQEELEAFSASMTGELERDSGADIASIGAIDYATANRNVALREATLIGAASIAMITLLLLATFRSVRPFLAIAFTVVTGVAGGFLICLIVFESVHVLTLIGGSSLIGISVDYSFHLLADGFRLGGRRWRVVDGLKAVLPAVALGLSTTLAGFLGLYASGFRGLQQIAVFSAGGLMIAFIGLILGYPWLLFRWGPHRRPAILRAAGSWSQLWRPGRREIFIIIACALALMLVTPRLETNSDIRLLSAQTPRISALQQRSAALSGSLLDSRFIVVEAQTVEGLLRREEALRRVLARLRDEGSLAHFNQLSQFVPSQQRQSQTVALHRALYAGPDSAAEQLSAGIGLANRVIRTHRQALARSPAFQPLELERWLASPLAPVASHLWLGEIDGRVASVVTLGGVNDVSRLSHALEQMDGVLLVDNVSAMSELFGRYVASAIRGLVIAFVLITLLMVSRFGLLQGTALVVVPLLSGALSLLCLGALNQPLNLFHIVGVALILGTGMDYALFLRSGRGRPETMLAVLLAAITTECAFGLLGLSQVRAIHSFGLTVALGTAWSFLLAPVVVKRTRTMAAQLTP